MALQLLDGETRIEVLDTELANVIDPDPEVVYTLRQILPAMRLQLQRRKANPQTRQMEADGDATIDAMLEFALVGWTGILANGQPAPCTTEYKRLLDQGRKLALVGKAASNRTAPEGRDASFREPASVV